MPLKRILRTGRLVVLSKHLYSMSLAAPQTQRLIQSGLWIAGAMQAVWEEASVPVGKGASGRSLLFTPHWMSQLLFLLHLAK